MTLWRSAFASIASQCYVALLALLVAPIYLRLLGAEAFGLIALSLSLQAVALVLDFGLTPTLARASAMYRAGRLAGEELANLWAKTRMLYFGVSSLAMVIACVSFILFPSMWTNSEQLTQEEIRRCLLLMFAVIVLRWWSDLYRGVLSGFERFVWLSVLNASLATARLVVIVPVLIWMQAGVEEFFLFQLLVALVEYALLNRATLRALPKREPGVPREGWLPLRRVYPFTLSMAVVTSCWVLVSQGDKILLASLVPLKEYGELTLAILAASSVVLVTMPLSAVILPRLTALSSLNERAAFGDLYSKATQWLGLLAWPAAAVLSIHAQTILYLWTGDKVLASKAAPLLQLYAVGNAVLAVSAVAYLGQFARGVLKLHVAGSVLFLILLFPLLIWTTQEFGVIGAAWTWLSLNLAYLLIWVYLVHRMHGPTTHCKWLALDVGNLAAFAFAGAAIATVFPLPESRLLLAAQIVGVGLVTLILTSLGSSWARRMLRKEWVAIAAKQADTRGDHIPDRLKK